MSKTVKLTTCYNSFEANVIKVKLESEGINSFLKNENFNTLYGGFSQSPLGIDIMVLEEDLEKATLVLEDTNTTEDTAEE